MSQINIAIVGLGFGAEFIPIYQNHPNAKMYAICQRTPTKLNSRRCVRRRETLHELEDVLADPNVDAIHINTPIPDHAAQSLAGLQGRQARGLHRADGHHDRRMPRRSSNSANEAARST